MGLLKVAQDCGAPAWCATRKTAQVISRAGLPSVGDYCTVADPLPNPAPGTGLYYVTAVTHQGQRRYGRQNIGGVMSGRDPALLPVCEQ